MEIETDQATPPAPVEDEQESSGGEGVVAVDVGEEEESPAATATTSKDVMVTHSEGETFTMPQSDSVHTTNTPVNEFLAAISNLGSIISTKAREVDQQAGISTKVANVNEKYHVSEKWSNFTIEFDEKYHVADKWSNLTSSVAARVEQIKEDRRKRMKESANTTGGSSKNNLLARENVMKSLNGATAWVSQRIQGIRSSGSVDENDGRETELPESK